MIDLSNAKWKWMSEKDVDKLDALFHENSMFVHMGGSWGKQPELDVIRTGNIHYKHAEIHDVDVKFAGCAGIVYSRIHLNSVVGGREVRFPFIYSDGMRLMINTYEYEKELSNPAFLPMFVPGFHHGAKYG